MDFDLPADIAAIVETTRSVANDLLPLEAEFQRTGVVPEKARRTLIDNGFYTLPFPEEFGGLGLGMLATVAVQAELAHLPPQFWAECRALHGPGPKMLIRHGTAQQKAEWLPPMLAGEMGVSFAVTEPHCGSDVGAMKTTARRQGDGWVLNGAKTYISNGPFADMCFVVAYTDRSKGPKQGLSVFIVPRSAEGFAITGTLELMGTATPGVGTFGFDEVKLPAEALLGDEGKGLHYAMEGLNAGRMAVGATALGMGDFALQMALEFAAERPAFGGMVSDFQAIRHMLADMATDMHAARLVAYDAAWRHDRGEIDRKRTSMAKLICTEAGGRTVDKALQIHGGAGYVRGTIVERLYRDVRITRIYEGSSEILRNQIAKQLLGD